jgi:hypothetical protein
MSSYLPNLIEPGTKYFLDATLKNCKKIKDKYYYYIFNASAFTLLIGILAIIMTFMYKGKSTPLELAQKSKEKREYILLKIKSLQDIKRQKRQELITNLPKWNSEIDLINRKLYK